MCRVCGKKYHAKTMCGTTDYPVCTMCYIRATDPDSLLLPENEIVMPVTIIRQNGDKQSFTIPFPKPINCGIDEELSIKIRNRNIRIRKVKSDEVLQDIKMPEH